VLTRHQRGVTNLKPELVQRIRDELAKGPVSKSELARRLQVSRPTILWYMKKLASQPNPGTTLVMKEKPNPVTTQATHNDVIDRVTRACDEVSELIATVKGSSSSVATASVAFKGYAVLERFLKLLAELRQEISPTQQNVFVQLATILNQPVDPASLTMTERRAVGMESDAPAA